MKIRLTPPEWLVLFVFAFIGFLILFWHIQIKIHFETIRFGFHMHLAVLGLEIGTLPLFCHLARAVYREILDIQPHASDGAIPETLLKKENLQETEAIRKGLRALRDWLPLLVSLAIYWLVPQLLQLILRRPMQDSVLAAWDLRLFGAHYTVLIQRFYTPFLTQIFEICYFLHIVIIPGTLALMYASGQRRLFEQTLFFLLAVTFVGSVIYTIVPAQGPIVGLRHLFTKTLSRNPFVADAIDLTRIPADCFPSLHAAISSGLLVYQWKFSRKIFWILLPFVVGNWIATIYLRYHYTVDLLAGFILSAFVVGMTEFIYAKQKAR